MAFTSIPTIVTNDVATASWGNTYLKDNFDAILTSSTTMNSAIVTSSLTTLGASVSQTGMATFTAGAAVTAASYQVGRDADGTNQLHLNVPTGASLEFSVNDVAQYQMDATNLTVIDNNAIALGTGADSRLYYDGTDTFWNLRAAGTGDLMIALEAGFPSPDAGIHVWAGSAGAVVASTSSMLILENDGAVIMSFLGPNSVENTILMGDVNNNAAARIEYNHSINAWRMDINGSQRLAYSASTFAFQEATTISTTAGDLTLNPTGLVRIDDTAAADTNSPTHVNTPTGVAAAQVGWLQISISGTTSYLPYWQ